MSEVKKTKKSFFGTIFGAPDEAEPDAVSGQPTEQADGPPSDVQEAGPVAEVAVGTENSDEARDVEPQLVRQQPAAVQPQPKVGWFRRLTSGLAKTSSKLTTGLSDLFTKNKLDASTLDELEDLLIQADLGVDTAVRITEKIGKGRFESGLSPEQVRTIVAGEIENVLDPVAKPLEIDVGRAPHVILVVGVNGSGKTTTIGKLAAQFKSAGKTCMIAAGDTFRAAAIDQLKVWGDRVGVQVISRPVGSDASGLTFDAMESARQRQADVLLIDTAGRLQNKRALMEELEKVIRVIRKQDETAPHDVLLVLDATTGQNALAQVDAFQNTAGVTGLVMTKLDGTARGGILVAIAAKYGLPVHAIGVGEGVEDLQSFNAGEFARAMTGAE